MAPQPEKEESEPKAPDKSEKLDQSETATSEINVNNEQTRCAKTEEIELQHMSHLNDEKTEAIGSDVSELNDGELRALLDEAYNYKSPKDREGKSEIFKKFLQEAETAETETQQPNLLFSEAPVRVTGGKRRPGRREVAVSERQSRCGSLQNLSQCHVEYPTSRRRHVGHLRRGASTSSTCSSATCESVSTRQREGGSLPCSVNAVHDLAGTNMAALRAGDVTIDVPSLEDLTSWHSTYNMPRLVSSQPNSEVSEMTSQDEVKTSPGFEHTSNTKQEIKSELVTRVEAVNMEKQKIRERAEDQLNHQEDVNPKYRSSMAWEINNSKPTQVDEVTDISYFRGIENFCLLQLHPTQDGNVIIPSSANVNLEISEGNAVRSVLGSNRQEVTAKSVISRGSSDRNKPPYYVSSNIQSAPHNYFQCSEPSALVSSQQKDDNGNYVREDKQTDNCTTLAQNKKRKKEREKNVKMTEEIEGFKGHEDLDSLLMYIEGEENRAQQNNKSKTKSKTKEVLCRRSHRHSEESDNVREKRGKFKEATSAANSNLKRANSLEEVSKTKLEDFSDPTDSSRSVGEGRTSQLSIDFDDEEQFTSHNNFYTALDTPPCQQLDQQEFHVVTKKQRRKKRTPNCTSKPNYEADDSILSFYRVKNDRRKCKSTSSMPPSDQSGDSDSDSIHSLPVSSTTGKASVDKTSSSSGGTPQASYADIARMAGDNHKIRSRSHKNSETTEDWPDVAGKNENYTHKHQETAHNMTKTNKNFEEWPDMVMKNQEYTHKNQDASHKIQDTTHKVLKTNKSSDNNVEWPDMGARSQDFTHKNQDVSHKMTKGHRNSDSLEERQDMGARNQDFTHKNQDFGHKNHHDMNHKIVKSYNNTENRDEWPDMDGRNEDFGHKTREEVVKNQELGHKSVKSSENVLVISHKTSSDALVRENHVNCVDTDCVSECSSATPPRDVAVSECSSATPPRDVTMPAVILSANIDVSSDVSGLTFGFEINDELLTNSKRDFASMFVNHKHLAHKQAADIVNFVGKAWDVVVGELGHVTQSDLTCAPVQFYKCT